MGIINNNYMNTEFVKGERVIYENRPCIIADVYTIRNKKMYVLSSVMDYCTSIAYENELEKIIKK